LRCHVSNTQLFFLTSTMVKAVVACVGGGRANESISPKRAEYGKVRETPFFRRTADCPTPEFGPESDGRWSRTLYFSTQRAGVLERIHRYKRRVGKCVLWCRSGLRSRVLEEPRRWAGIRHATLGADSDSNGFQPTCCRAACKLEGKFRRQKNAAKDWREDWLSPVSWSRTLWFAKDLG